MDEQVKHALERDRTVDITTKGRRTGKPRRKEIWFHNVDGRLYLTGTPGRRDWYANLLAHPEFTFHLKRSVRADLPAKAPDIHGAKETVAMRSDREGLDCFQEGGPGWQDRINDALRKAAGK